LTEKPNSGNHAIGGAGPASSNTHGWVNLTPLSTVNWGSQAIPNGRFSDAYTRLIITSKTPDNCGNDTACGSADNYPYKQRDFLERLFVGSQHTINLTAKIAVGSFSATVPLATIDHISNRNEGEGFSRTIYHQATQYPLFLIKGDGSNGVAAVQFEVKGSDAYQSSAAATTLQIAQQITTAVAPQAAVLTALTAQSNKNLAAAIDKAVSQLFGTQISEQHVIDEDMTKWGTGVKATFALPRKEGDWDKVSDYATVGTWTVTFENPRPSIFSDAQICADPAHEETGGPKRCFATFTETQNFAEKTAALKPADILRFPLLNGANGVGTIGAYLKQQEWWDKSLKAFPTDKAPPADMAPAFCRAIKDAIAGLQLNYVDGGIVTAAVLATAGLPSKTMEALQSVSGKGQDCGLALDREES
jgi:hypothetical protein